MSQTCKGRCKCHRFWREHTPSDYPGTWLRSPTLCTPAFPHSPLLSPHFPFNLPIVPATQFSCPPPPPSGAATLTPSALDFYMPLSYTMSIPPSGCHPAVLPHCRGHSPPGPRPRLLSDWWWPSIVGRSVLPSDGGGCQPSKGQAGRLQCPYPVTILVAGDSFLPILCCPTTTRPVQMNTASERLATALVVGRPSADTALPHCCAPRLDCGSLCALGHPG